MPEEKGFWDILSQWALPVSLGGSFGMAGFNAMQQAQAARANDRVRREMLTQAAQLQGMPTPSFAPTADQLAALTRSAMGRAAAHGTQDSTGEVARYVAGEFFPIELQARQAQANWDLARRNQIAQLLGGTPAYPTFPMTGDPFSSMMGVAGSMEAMKLIRQMIEKRGAVSPYGTPMGYEDPGLIGAEQPVGPAGSGGQPSPEQFYLDLFGGSGRGGGWE